MVKGQKHRLSGSPILPGAPWNLAPVVLHSVLFFFAAGLAALFTKYDREWSKWLQHMSGEPWVRWMDQSLFEGEALGASDLPILLYLSLLFLLGMFIFLKPPAGVKAILVRVLVTGFVLSVVTHGVKWAASRPRPKDVYSGACEFRDWYQFNEASRSCSGKPQKGSFPSGHTSAAASLWAFVAAFDSRRKAKATSSFAADRAKAVSWLNGVLYLMVFVFAVAMGVARVAHGDHWLTDIWASVVLTWCIVMWIWRPRLSYRAQVLGDLPLETK